MTEATGRAFRLTTIWHVDGSVDEAISIFHDMESIVDWWSAAFMRVEVVDPGGAASLGKVVRLHTKGLLPHTFQFLARVSDGPRPGCVEVQVRGDFDGSAIMAVTQEGPALRLDFEWRVRIRHPWIGTIAPFFRPVLAFNHRWVMAQGKAGFQREIYRRRGALPAVPAHRWPRPTFPHNLAFVRALYGWRASVRRWPD